MHAKTLDKIFQKKKRCFLKFQDSMMKESWEHGGKF
jgi:hypothetical protein